jgi:quercetin dioxygenase-like cupin family protein
MKPSLPLLLAALSTLPASTLAATVPDAVAVDPAVHNVLLDNEHVRVFTARASHGAKSPMHSHPPFVFIGLDTARVRLTQPDGAKALLDTHPGLVMWMGEPMQHSWELLSGELDVIAVEVKSAQRGETPSPSPRPADDSVAVHPDVHKVLFENDHVRVFDARASVGASSAMHSHPPSVLVPLAAGRLRAQMPDGSRAILDFNPGQVIWMADGAQHKWEILAGDPHVIVVEPKSAQLHSDRK